MKKRLISLLLCLSMLFGMLPASAFAAVGDFLSNGAEKNQSILNQLSALSGGDTQKAQMLLESLGLLDKEGNLKLSQSIELNGKSMTLAQVKELLEQPGTDLTEIASVDGTPIALGDLKIILQIEAELARIKERQIVKSSATFCGKRLQKEFSSPSICVVLG